MIVRARLWWLAFAASCGAACGGGWVDADTKSATDAVHIEATALELCEDDGGPCKPSQVRALERAAMCANESMLARHGKGVPEAGVQCQAP